MLIEDAFDPIVSAFSNVGRIRVPFGDEDRAFSSASRLKAPGFFAKGLRMGILYVVLAIRMFAGW